MRIFSALLTMALLIVPAYGQPAQMPRYGETDNLKTPSEIERAKQADEAYKRSLGNIPNAKVADPWGDVRGDGTPKGAAKPAPAKRAKSAPAGN